MEDEYISPKSLSWGKRHLNTVQPIEIKGKPGLQLVPGFVICPVFCPTEAA
jgi:hypothetical protein